MYIIVKREPKMCVQKPDEEINIVQKKNLSTKKNRNTEIGSKQKFFLFTMLFINTNSAIMINDCINIFTILHFVTIKSIELFMMPSPAKFIKFMFLKSMLAQNISLPIRGKDPIKTTNKAKIKNILILLTCFILSPLFNFSIICRVVVYFF